MPRVLVLVLLVLASCAATPAVVRKRPRRVDPGPLARVDAHAEVAADGVCPRRVHGEADDRTPETPNLLSGTDSSGGITYTWSFLRQ